MSHPPKKNTVAAVAERELTDNEGGYETEQVDYMGWQPNRPQQNPNYRNDNYAQRGQGSKPRANYDQRGNYE